VTVTPWGGVFAWQGGVLFPQKASQFLIERNTFKVTGAYADGFGMASWWGDFRAAFGAGEDCWLF